MRKILGLVLGMGMMGSVAHADIVCKADANPSKMQPAVVLTISSDQTQASVQLDGGKPETLALDHSVWDGHATGMMTGKGIAVVYNDWYGCIHNAELITDLRPNSSAGNIGKVDFATCTGGSTSDKLCSGDVPSFTK